METGTSLMCVWSDVKNYDVDFMLEFSQDIETVSKRLTKLFKLDSEANKQIMLDLFVSAFKFAHRHNFSHAAISSFLSIIKRLHDECCSTPYGNFLQCVQLFRDLLAVHVVHRPPWTLKIFDTTQAQLVYDYIVDVYLRHYKMFKYAFTPRIKMDVTFKYCGVPSVGEEIEAAPSEESLSKSGEEEEEHIESAEYVDPEPENELEAVIKQAIQDQLKILDEQFEQTLEEADLALIDKVREIHGESHETAGKHSKKGKK